MEVVEAQAGEMAEVFFQRVIDLCKDRNTQMYAKFNDTTILVSPASHPGTLLRVWSMKHRLS